MNINRLELMFNEITKYGQTNKGINRLAYSEEETQALNYIKSICDDEGFLVKKDSIGNMIIRREGTQTDLPVVATGSHIDSVYEAGKYDGVIGVVSALEVLRSLNEENIETTHPIELIIFACEESARFGTATIGSKAMTGMLKKEDTELLVDRNGISFKKALEDVGLSSDDLQTVIRDKSEFKCFIELHIEQGPILEQKQIDIGIVSGIAAPTRFKVNVIGEASHSGSTPMSFRKDALTGAAEISLMLESIAQAEAHHGTVATVGVCKVSPGAMNVVPGEVELMIDIRSIDAQSKKRVVDQFTLEVNDITKRRSLSATIDLLSDEVPILMNRKIIDKLTEVCKKRELTHLEMPSGAGHDAMNMAKYCATSMIFVPSKDGLSHNQAEFTALSDIAKGANVLKEILIKLAK